MRSRVSHLLGAAVGVFFMVIGAVVVKAPAMAATEDYALIYPSPDQLFGPRLYGKGDPPNKVTLLVAGAFRLDEHAYLGLYQPLMNLVYAGNVLLDLKIVGHNQVSFPIYLAAQCVAPVGMPKFLHDVFTRSEKLFYESTTDIDTALLQVAQRDPIFRPQGLTPEQFDRRMRWCLSQRERGIVEEETRRFQAIYDYKLTNMGGVLAPAIVVNDKVREGGFNLTEIMREMK